jgi:hypothetical protein
MSLPEKYGNASMKAGDGAGVIEFPCTLNTTAF